MSDLAGSALERTQTIALIFATLGLCLAPLVRLPRRPLFSLPVFAFIVLFQVRSTQLSGSPFPVNGNIIDNTGYFSCCNMAPLWPQQIWLLIGVVGAALFSFYIVALAEWLSDWLRTRPWPDRTSSPALFLY